MATLDELLDDAKKKGQATGAAINANNPDANPDKPYWQNTDLLNEGSSLTGAQAQQGIDAFRQTGASDAWGADFLSRNNNDFHRLASAYESEMAGGSDRNGNGSSVSNTWTSHGGGKANDFYDQLMARSKQSLTIDRNDPNIRAESDAFRANQDRSRREYLNDLAERQGPLANLLGEQRLTQSKVGQSTGAFEAELMNREKTARRDEIAQALNLMAGRLTAEETASLQRELAQLDAQLRREGYGMQGDQFDKNLAFQMWMAQNGMGLF